VLPAPTVRRARFPLGQQLSQLWIALGSPDQHAQHTKSASVDAIDIRLVKVFPDHHYLTVRPKIVVRPEIHADRQGLQSGGMCASRIELFRCQSGNQA
jgi:hypothetical protein